MGKKPPAKVSISMPWPMAKRIQMDAVRNEMTVSELVRSMIRSHYKEDEKSK